MFYLNEDIWYKMRVLFLSQGRDIEDHPGWHDALVRLKAEGEIEDFKNIPYFGYAEKYGWQSFYDNVIDIAKNESFNLIYFHYFHSKGKPSAQNCIKTLSEIKPRPIIITSCGDGFSDNWMRPDFPEDFKEVSRLADITFSTQMGKAADKMIRWGAKNVVLSPNSMCQVRFKAQKIDLEKHRFDFDVVFVGSNNSNRLFNPVSKAWFAAKERNSLVKALTKRYGKSFGLFGNGWNYSISQGPVKFNEQQNTFHRGRVIVGGNPYSHSDYYSSNRVFFEISSGVPTVELFVPRLDKIFRDNEHLYFANDISSLLKKIDQLLDRDPITLYRTAGQAAEFVEKKHTQYHRMLFKLNTVKEYIQNGYRLNVIFPFFLDEVDQADEKKYALRIKG